MKAFSPDGRLVKAPVQTLLLSVATGLLTLLCIEGILRLPATQAMLPFPSYGTYNAEFSIKVGRLDALTAATGRPDCLLMGSSVMDADGDVAAFTQAYSSSRNRALNCYNFALPGLPPASAGHIGRFLISRYHPNLLIYSVSAFEFSDDFTNRERGVYDQPWVHYAGGEFNWAGWFVDNSSVTQHLSTIKYATDYTYHNLYDDAISGLDEYGFLARPGIFTYQPSSNFQLAEFRLNPDGLAGFQSFLSLRSTSEPELLVVEEPIQPDYLTHNYMAGRVTSYNDNFIQPIEAMARSQGVPFVRVDTLKLDPAKGWADPTHLNRNGAGVFSAWLASRVGQLVDQGLVSDPGR